MSIRKRPESSETLGLAIEILKRIPKKRKITCSEIQEQLSEIGIERDIRTIQRQLESLSLHFDIERDDRSKPYGYRWKEMAEGFSIPGLSEQDSLLLNLAEQYLRNLLPVSLMKSMEGFFTQARCNLTKPDKKKSSEWLSKVRVVSTTQPLLPPEIKPGVFEAVSNALYANLWLIVDYENQSGYRQEAEVMPLGLAQQGERIYLVVRFKGHDNERSLALHRIHKAKATTFTFKRPKEFDLKKYDNDGRFGYGEGEKIKLTFRIGKEAGFHLLESKLSHDQTHKELEDEYEITATVVDTAMLDWWLNSFGEEVSYVEKSLIDS